MLSFPVHFEIKILKENRTHLIVVQTYGFACSWGFYLLGESMWMILNFQGLQYTVWFSIHCGIFVAIFGFCSNDNCRIYPVSEMALIQIYELQ